MRKISNNYSFLFVLFILLIPILLAKFEVLHKEKRVND